ncbi:tax1-binding protein 1 homolog B isoform X2 [Megalops cyprinoides]|uniref:tax1-binding protein 1 homolog B isoform X2 n=1 Tax=Megalops cyprinoides TaxID=118141 RepID=UPI0018651918|nr:tax1-binding protein 1 homolog B isoform X2 [Megalops cyprinoides]
MALFQEGTSTSSAMETSNFAHVIFQNVGKSYLPHAALECHYTLTQFIKPHQKDWVGIFKVGWSTARDYYTFLWSPFPENYAEGTTVNRAVVFQGYYVPNDDGEFYQFCYVTHKGEIRGASTPFQFRASNPTDDLLTVEDENNSDILVVTTKAGLLEQKVEVAQKEKEELMKAMSLLQKEKDELQEEKEKLQGELEQERELCSQLRKENQELQSSSRTLQEEREEVKKRHQEVAARVHQLEEDLIGVTQKGIQKETELDCLRDRVKKLTLEKDTLESQLKNERDEKELYKVHLKNRELENTKLMAELQMQKSVDVNKENMITQFKEEVGRLRTCVAEKEKLQKELLSNASPLGEMNALKEKLRQTEEQLQATRQQAAMLASELRDASSARDRSMSELHRLRVEMEALRKSQADAQAQCARMEEQLDKMKATAQQETQGGAEGGAGTEAELQREVEDLKLRLQMAAEHYKDKYKECQRLQKQVAKLSEQQGEAKKNAVAAGASAADGTVSPLSTSPELPAQGSPTSSSVALEALIQEKLKGMNKVTEKSDKYKKCKQMLSEEKERSCMFADELAKMEVKWKEQLKMNDSLKLQLAAEEDRYKSQVAEKGREVKELKENLALLMKEKEKLEEELRKGAEGQVEQGAADLSLESAQPLLLQYPLPYTQDEPPAPLVAQQSTDLQFGNPYTAPHSRDGADGEFSSDQMPRLPPAGPPSWDSNVVCIQPSRNLSRPDGLEDPEEHSNGNDAEQPAAAAGDPRSPLLNDGRGGFCFDSSLDIQKRCPLCEVIFPPNYDQSKFEEHVESHWKVCPMCSEQFPLDCDQRLFEKHVLTHFDGNVLNFD